MKNAYLFAIEFDEWAKLLGNELSQISDKKEARNLVKNLRDVKTNLSLLAIELTGSLGQISDRVEFLMKDCESSSSINGINNSMLVMPHMTYMDTIDGIISSLANLKNELENEKSDEQKQREGDDFEASINQFNKQTKAVAFNIPKEGSSSSSMFKSSKSEEILFKDIKLK